MIGSRAREDILTIVRISFFAERQARRLPPQLRKRDVRGHSSASETLAATAPALPQWWLHSQPGQPRFGLTMKQYSQAEPE